MNRRPPRDARSFCAPKRLAWPAARIKPPIWGGSTSVRGRKRFGGQASTAAVTADGDDLREDGERDLLDATCADVQSDRRMDARDVAVRHALRPQPRDPLLVGGPAADRSDIS